MTDLRVIDTGGASGHAARPAIPNAAIRAAARLELRLHERRKRVLPRMRGSDTAWQIVLYLAAHGDDQGGTSERKVFDFLDDYENVSRRWIELMLGDGVLQAAGIERRLGLTRETLAELTAYYFDLISAVSGQED